MSRGVWFFTGVAVAAPIFFLWGKWVGHRDQAIMQKADRARLSAVCEDGISVEIIQTGKVVCIYGPGRFGSPLDSPIKKSAK